MFNNSASALIVALLMIMILSIISVSLLNFINFYYLDASRFYEFEKLKLASENDILETILSVRRGEFITNTVFRTNTDDFVYKVSRRIFSTNNLYTVVLDLESPKARVRRSIKFYAITPTDFCYIILDRLNIKKDTKGVFWGYSFVRGALGESDNLFFSYTYPPLFSDITNLNLVSYIASADISPETPSLNLNIKHKTNIVNPASISVDINEIVKKIMPLVSKGWLIDSRYQKTEEIQNSLISEKEYLGRFSYSEVKIRLSKPVENIYFSRSRDSETIDILNNSDTFGSRGEVTSKFIKFEDGFLTFNTSPVQITLQPESFYEPYKIKLNSDTLRNVSEYRKVIGVYLEDTNRNLLNDGVILDKDILTIISPDIRSRYYTNIGKGDGVRSRFRISTDINPQKVFVGGREIRGFYIDNFEIVMPSPPEKDKDIIVMHKIPKVFIRKSLPENGIHIFTDKTDKAVLIDFDSIQNLPKNGIIFSKNPIILRGSPNEPVIVVSEDNIYIDSINRIPNPKTLVIISAKGVFLKEDVEVLRNVIILSKLDGIYRVGPSRTDDVSEERSKWIFGTVILTSELKNSVANNSKKGYITSYENPINNSTFSISPRVMSDYLSDSEFGRTLRYILPPIVVVVSIR